jgi:predicted extracellular nuclease
MLIIGDLNAYSQEDPIEVLVEAGYTDLLPAFSDCPEYTYVYKGEAGALDHAFASSSLVRQVEDVQVWHINADEPSVLGYSSNYKSALQVIKLYRNDPFRSSDHDPLIVGIDLR